MIESITQMVCLMVGSLLSPGNEMDSKVVLARGMSQDTAIPLPLSEMQSSVVTS